MAVTENNIDDIVKGFIAYLCDEIDIEEVILFGSYAKGAAKEHSDIDLAIISDWFMNKSYIKNMQFLSRKAAKYNSLIEALPFTAQEYNNPDHRTLLANIIKSGRKFPIKEIINTRKKKSTKKQLIKLGSSPQMSG
jgi:predicted nucleotidyltransferase